MGYFDVFKMPNPVTIVGRSSSITNSFVNGIIPCIQPSEDEIHHVLIILGMDKDSVRCAYCGDKFTEWDHFRPLIKNKLPTGFITEINNLIPVCGKCNQSKGNKNWKEWINSGAKLSPKSRQINNLEMIIQKLEDFESKSKPMKIDFESIVGKELWEAHWKNCSDLHTQMKETQTISNKIRELVRQTIVKKATRDSSKGNSDNRRGIQRNRTTLSDDLGISDRDPSTMIKRVGNIVQSDFRELQDSNRFDKKDIEELQNPDYSKQIFGVNYPVLKKIVSNISVSEQRKDHFGRDRYYADPIVIRNEEYLLTSQWFDRNKQKLLKFISKNG